MMPEKVMDENRLKFAVGVLVIASIATGVILTFLFGAIPNILNREYMLMVSFPSADGIKVNSPVVMRGVQIGRVSGRELRQDDVLLTIGIEAAYQETLTRQYLPRIGSSSLITGDANLEFVKAKPEELVGLDATTLTQSYQNQDYLSSVRSSGGPFDLLMGMEDELAETLQSVRGASESLQSVSQNVNALVDDAKKVVGNTDQNLDAFSTEAREAIVEFQGLMTDLRGLFGDPEFRAALGDSVSELPTVMKELQSTLRSSRDTFDAFEKIGRTAEGTVENADAALKDLREAIVSAKGTAMSAQKTFSNLEKITDPLAANSDELAADLFSTIKSLNGSLQQVEVFLTAANNNEGTLRRLLEDDEVYWHLKRTIENAEIVSAKLIPIIDDARVFSDKIARDPRQLGVKGALDRRGTGLGLK